jgi:hypothetical protein
MPGLLSLEKDLRATEISSKEQGLSRECASVPVTECVKSLATETCVCKFADVFCSKNGWK